MIAVPKPTPISVPVLLSVLLSVPTPISVPVLLSVLLLSVPTPIAVPMHILAGEQQRQGQTGIKVQDPGLIVSLKGNYQLELEPRFQDVEAVVTLPRVRSRLLGSGKGRGGEGREGKGGGGG